MKIILKKKIYILFVLTFLSTNFLCRAENKKIEFAKDPDPLNRYWPSKEETVVFFETLDMNLVSSLKLKPGFNRQEFIHRLISSNFTSKELLEIYPSIPQQELIALRNKARKFNFKKM